MAAAARREPAKAGVAPTRGHAAPALGPRERLEGERVIGGMLDVSFRLRTFHDLTVEELYGIFRLRVEVFIVEQDCPYQDVDGLDPVALHLLGTNASGDLVAYARLLPAGAAYPDAAAIGRVVTARAARGAGLGKRLMEVAISEVGHRFGAGVGIRLGAQNYAIPFYRRLGFSPVGESYLEDGIPHTTMVLER